MWSIKVAGLTAAVRAKIIDWPNPTDDLNGQHFTAAQSLIADMLLAIPATAVSVQAKGECFHDGRSNCSIQVDPLELVIGDVIEKAERFDRIEAEAFAKAAAAAAVSATVPLPVPAVDQAPAPAVDQAPTPAPAATVDASPVVATVDPSTLSDHERAALKSAGV